MKGILDWANPLSKTIWVTNVSKWKRPVVKRYFRGCRVKFIGIKENPFENEKGILKSNPVFVVWGRYVPDAFRLFSLEHSVEIWHMEDGFIRSVGLGASHVLPYSLCIDKKGLYYDSGSESDLECIIKNRSFTDQEKQRASSCIDIIKEQGLSKYNFDNFSAADSYVSLQKKNILVVGQVEDDQSLIYGCENILNNSDLLKLAVEENPDANIIYKPHPDVLNGFREERSSIEDMEDRVIVVDVNVAITAFFDKIDQLYTLTSLAGFEALMAGVKVTTLGAPFYSGWGLTDDRQIVPRRCEQRTLEEVFTAAYICYAKYMDPETGKRLTLEHVVDLISSQIHKKKIKERLDAGVERVYSLSSFHPMPVDYLIRAQSINKVCVLTDSKCCGDLVSEMAELEQVDVVTTRERLANDGEFLGAFYGLSNVNVSSMHKFNAAPMSVLETRAVQLTEKIADQLYKVSSTIVGEAVESSFIREVCDGVKDYMYFDAYRFLLAEDVVKSYDAVVTIFEDPDGNSDVINSIYYHADKERCLSKVFYHNKGGGSNKELFGYLRKGFAPVYEIFSDSSGVSERFRKYFWSLKAESKNLFPELRDFVALCGSLNENNYAYSPSSYFLIDEVLALDNCDVIYFNYGFANSSVDDNLKSSLFEKGGRRSVYVYDGVRARFSKSFSGDSLNDFLGLKEDVFDYFRVSILRIFPVALVDSLSSRMNAFLDVWLNMMLVYIEIDSLFERVKAFGSSMYNGFFSRALSEIAKGKGKNTFAIQPQVISTSARYKAPNVDSVGVIDSFQRDNLLRLGYEGDVKLVGSVNLIERLKEIESHACVDYGEKFDVFFAMQHSAPKAMREIAQFLYRASLELGINVVVKPHPHQEVSVENAIHRQLDADNFLILGKSADTYEYVARSQVVVGYFSSVIFESAVYGKEVVVVDSCHGADGSLDCSVDFSRDGLAKKASSYESFLEIISNSFGSSDVSYEKKYFEANQHLLPKYGNNVLSEFIKSNV